MVHAPANTRHQQRFYRFFPMTLGLALLAAAGCGSGPAPGPTPKGNTTEVKPPKPGAQKPETILYRSWINCQRLRNSQLELVMVPALGRILRIAPIRDNGNTQLPDDNLLWINQRWTGMVRPMHYDPREWPVFGGVRQLPGPQMKWPLQMVADRRQLVDVHVAWPPDSDVDLVAYKKVKSGPGYLHAEHMNPSQYGLKGELKVASENDKLFNLDFNQTNVTDKPLEALSQTVLTLNTNGWMAARKDQILDPPALWPEEFIQTDNWMLWPLNIAVPRKFEMRILPQAGHSAYVLIWKPGEIMILHAHRPDDGIFPRDEATFRFKRGILGLPDSVMLKEPQAPLCLELGASTPQYVLEPGQTVTLRIRVAHKKIKALKTLPAFRKILDRLEFNTPDSATTRVVSKPDPAKVTVKSGDKKPPVSPDGKNVKPPVGSKPVTADAATPTGQGTKPPAVVDKNKPPTTGPADGGHTQPMIGEDLPPDGTATVEQPADNGKTEPAEIKPTPPDPNAPPTIGPPDR